GDRGAFPRPVLAKAPVRIRLRPGPELPAGPLGQPPAGAGHSRAGELGRGRLRRPRRAPRTGPPGAAGGDRRATRRTGARPHRRRRRPGRPGDGRRRVGHRARAGSRARRARQAPHRGDAGRLALRAAGRRGGGLRRRRLLLRSQPRFRSARHRAAAHPHGGSRGADRPHGLERPDGPRHGHLRTRAAGPLGLLEPPRDGAAALLRLSGAVGARAFRVLGVRRRRRRPRGALRPGRIGHRPPAPARSAARPDRALRPPPRPRPRAARRLRGDLRPAPL
ncbi:MAG: hypothetical protein AVDCRST_MAG69-1048, partial [uncultured Solirubrobacteraceae bacterium]